MQGAGPTGEMRQAASSRADSFLTMLLVPKPAGACSWKRTESAVSARACCTSCAWRAECRLRGGCDSALVPCSACEHTAAWPETM